MSVTADHFADTFQPTQTPYAPPASRLENAETDSGVYPSIFSSRGRVGRLQLVTYYTAMYLLLTIAFSVFVAVISIGADTTSSSDGVVGALLLATYVPIMALSFIWTIKRCHDFNASGWWSLLNFVPLANLAFFVIPGTAGTNKHGFKRPNRWYHWCSVVAFIGLVVVGILAAIAIPAYQDYALRAAGTL